MTSAAASHPFSQKKRGDSRLSILLAIFLSLTPAPFALAAPHDDHEPLTVAVYEMAPYGVNDANGTFSGASVDLWRRTAEAVGLDYVFVSVPQMDAILSGLREGRYDVAIGAITITPERAAHLDFSFPAHRSGVAVALLKDRGVGAALAAYGLVALELSSLILAMFALLLLIGVVMWYIERPRRVDGEVEESSVMSLRDGIYWAVVTMTTVGYGDKTPKTPIGRLFAIFWMLGSVALVSLLSASLVSRLTVEHLESSAAFKAADFSGRRIAAAASSSGDEYLDDLHLPHQKYATLQQALDALDAGEADVVVNSVGALRYLVASRFAKTLRVAPTLLAPAYMAFALPEHSALKKPIDRALMKITASPEWHAVEESYFQR